MIYIVLAVALVGCRLTDYSEQDEITTDIINTPTSDGTSKGVAELKLDVDMIDLGQMTQGEQVNYDLGFTNIGEGPLVLTDVRASCGCTVGKNWPREPVAPGKKGSIEVSFNSEGKSGFKESTISIVANTRPATTTVVLKANIIAPELSN